MNRSEAVCQGKYWKNVRLQPACRARSCPGSARPAPGPRITAGEEVAAPASVFPGRVPSMAEWGPYFLHHLMLVAPYLAIDLIGVLVAASYWRRYPRVAL